MAQWRHPSSAPCGPTPSVQWQMVTSEEIPAEWRRAEAWAANMSPRAKANVLAALDLPPGTEVTHRIALEMPDIQAAWAWRAWYTGQEGADLPTMISNHEEWRGRDEEFARTLRMLLEQGRPAPIFIGAWSRVE